MSSHTPWLALAWRKPKKKQSKSHGAHLVFLGFWNGFMVFWWDCSVVIVLPKRPLTREYPKHPLDNHLYVYTIIHLLCMFIYMYVYVCNGFCRYSFLEAYKITIWPSGWHTWLQSKRYLNRNFWLREAQKVFLWVWQVHWLDWTHRPGNWRTAGHVQLSC